MEGSRLPPPSPPPQLPDPSVGWATSQSVAMASLLVEAALLLTNSGTALKSALGGVGLLMTASSTALTGGPSVVIFVSHFNATRASRSLEKEKVSRATQFHCRKQKPTKDPRHRHKKNRNKPGHIHLTPLLTFIARPVHTSTLHTVPKPSLSFILKGNSQPSRLTTTTIFLFFLKIPLLHLSSGASLFNFSLSSAFPSTPFLNQLL